MKKVPLEVAAYPVGLEQIVADFEMTITESAKNHSGVQIVVIWGMGGSGKTTLAKELYNKKSLTVNKSSFVYDIRVSAANKKLHKKQRQLLEDLGYEFKSQSFDNTEQGKMVLDNYLKSLFVFVVLDDVDHRDQLEILLHGMGSLASGSLIIITTRNKEVLSGQGISCIYEMKSMNKFHAEQLFCWHAFLQSSPLLGFENLVEEFINVSNGLPLSLKVLGGQLYGCCNKNLWKDLLCKISRILPNDIINRLKVSYDALDEEEKQMFLDVACFFIGQDKMIAIEVWEGSGWSGQWGWERLVNKCLVELVDDNKIRMHDHLRDLGRKIASTLEPHRLWSPNQLMVINKQEQIRGMILDATNNDIHKLPDSLLNTSTKRARRPLPCYGLHIFLVKNNNLHIARLSGELAWLRCEGIAHKNLPSWMSLPNLRVLQFYSCEKIVSLWTDGIQAPVDLRVLIVSECFKLKRIPKSIGSLKQLKKISVVGGSVKNLPEEFCDLQSLEHLELNGLTELLSLPKCFGHLTNLQHLDLSQCTQLSMLPDSFKQLTLLQHLDLSSCRQLSMLPDSFKQLTLLQHLKFEQCTELILQQDILENMTRVEYLNLNGCSRLEELPRHITNQASLSALYLGWTKLKDLPINIGHLSKLRVMSISPVEGCFQMQSLPDSMWSLILLTELQLGNLNLQSLPDSMGSFILLTRLQLSNLNLQSLPKSFKQLISLHFLRISNCPMDDFDFGQTFLGSNLKEIWLERTRVPKISISDGCCPHLRSLELRYNHDLREVDTLPTTLKHISVIGCKLLRNMTGIGGLVSLQYLSLLFCPELEMLPSFGKLASLKELELKGGNKVERIEGLEECKSLETLCIDGVKCWDVLGTKSSGNFQRLKKVHLVAKKRSTLLPCIGMIEKWPEEMRICTKVSGEAGSLLKSSAFPNLFDVQFSAMEKYETFSNRFLYVEPPMIICYVIKCNSPTHFDRNGFCSELEEGKWVRIAAFTKPAGYYPVDGYSPCVLLSEEECEMEWGTVGIGDEGSVVKAFHHLLELLAA